MTILFDQHTIVLLGAVVKYAQYEFKIITLYWS